jgi:glycopeptide antibiotics resistance protein
MIAVTFKIIDIVYSVAVVLATTFFLQEPAKILPSMPCA